MLPHCVGSCGMPLAVAVPPFRHLAPALTSSRSHVRPNVTCFGRRRKDDAVPSTKPKGKPGRPTREKKAEMEAEWAEIAEAAGAVHAGPPPATFSRSPTSPTSSSQAAEAPAAAAAAPAAARASAKSAQDEAEADARRYPIHRRLMSAAQAGDPQVAEEAVAQLAAAGFNPGPRAWHTLLMSYLKAGDLQAGLNVAARADEEDILLLPESYQALVYAYLAVRPPRTDVAAGVVGAMRASGQDPTPAWTTQVTQLAVAEAWQEAVAAARQGMDELGLVPSEGVAVANVRALCALGQLDAAGGFVRSFAREYGGGVVGTVLFNPLIRAYAAAGQLEEAQGWVDEAGSAGWIRNADTYNGLLAGVVAAMTGEEGDDATFRFQGCRSQMLAASLRPTTTTWQLLVEGWVKAGDPIAAMGALKSLRTASATQGTRLLDPGSLSSLLSLLAAADLPVELLRLLVAMAEDRCPLPPAALTQDPEGRTFLSTWVVGHMEAMRSRAAAAARAAQEAGAITIREVDDVLVGVGDCVVNEAGVPLPLSKMKVADLRVEAAERGATGVEELRRPELLELVKAGRARLPPALLEAAAAKARAAEAAAGPAGAGGTSGASSAAYRQHVAAKSSKRPRHNETQKILRWREGKLVDVETEVLPEEDEMAAVMIRNTGGDDEGGGGAGAATPEEYDWSSNLAKNTSGIDYELLIQDKYLDEGTSTILGVGEEDVNAGVATIMGGADNEDDDDEEEGGRKRGGGAAAAAGPGMGLVGGRSSSSKFDALDALKAGYELLAGLEEEGLDATAANAGAGMAVALDLLRALDIVGGVPSPLDLLTLAQGAEAEASVEAAGEVAKRLGLVLGATQAAASSSRRELVPAGGGGMQVLDEATAMSVYERMAQLCLDQGSPSAADEVLEGAESHGLMPSGALLAQLRAALGRQPRRSERDSLRAAAMAKGIGLGLEDIDELITTPREDEDTLEEVELEWEVRQDSSELAQGLREVARAGGEVVPVVEAEVVGVEEAAAAAGDKEEEEEVGEPMSRDGFVSAVKAELSGYDIMEELDAEFMAHMKVLKAAGASEVMSEAEMAELLMSPEALASYEHLPPALLKMRAAAGQVDGHMQQLAAAAREAMMEEGAEEFEEEFRELLEILEADPQAGEPGDEEEVARLRAEVEAAGLRWDLPRVDESEIEAMMAAAEAEVDEEGEEEADQGGVEVGEEGWLESWMDPAEKEDESEVELTGADAEEAAESAEMMELVKQAAMKAATEGIDWPVHSRFDPADPEAQAAFISALAEEYGPELLAGVSPEGLEAAGLSAKDLGLEEAVEEVRQAVQAAQVKNSAKRSLQVQGKHD